jgi:type II secretory pathway component GspD/PulD (secretin)
MHGQPILVALLVVTFANAGLSQDPSATAPKSRLESPSPSQRPRSTSTCRVVDVCDLLEQYASLTRFKVIRDNFVQGKVSIDDVSGLEREKAVEIIERTLFSDGFSITQIDPTTVEVSGSGRSARAIGVPVISDPRALPVQERLVTFVFSFKHRTAEEMQRLFAQHLSPPQAYTSFLAEPKSNTVMITDRTSVIRRLIEIAAKMDVPDWKKEP